MVFEDRDIELANQNPLELEQFLLFAQNKNVKRYLEIGCRNGETFYRMMKTIGPQGFGMAIDLPENQSSQANLQNAVDQLRSEGIKNVFAKFGDCKDALMVRIANHHRPYDLVLIDADHRYDAAKRDFEIYHHCGRFIALHDIAAPHGHFSDGYPNGVPLLWSELKNHHEITTEIVEPGSNMGFGIIDLGEKK